MRGTAPGSWKDGVEYVIFRLSLDVEEVNGMRTVKITKIVLIVESLSDTTPRSEDTFTRMDA